MPPTKEQALPSALRQQDTTQQRQLSIETRAIDADARTIELALSSEYPVERYFGMEVLDHSPESVDLSRLQNGAAVLVNHNFDDHVGVVESVRIDADRRVRVQVRLGKSARATEIFNDVNDGILRHVSVGYQIHEAVLDETRDDGPDVYRITRWTPYEVSLVTVPADPTVGIGRSAAPGTSAAPNPEPKPEPQPEPKTEDRTMDPKDNQGTAEPKSVDTAAIERQAREGEITRAKSIRNIASKFGLTDEGERAIHDGATVEQFRADALDALGARSTAQQGTPITHLDMEAGDKRAYSLVRAIEAARTGNWKDAGLELEASQEISERLGRDARGFYVPYEIQSRAMGTGTGAAGGNLVGTDHLAGDFIENLRAQSLVTQLGARVLTGLVGDVDIPRMDASVAFGWVLEDGDGSESDAQIGQVKLQPKTITGQTPITRRLLKQASPDIDALLLADMQRGAALGIDKAALEGATNGPTGITGTSGVATSTITVAGDMTFAEAVAFQTEVDTANALMGNLAYLLHPAVAGKAKIKAKDSGSGKFLLEGGEIDGYRAISSTQLAANRIIFGNFSDIVIGMWGVLDVMPDTAAKAASGGLVLRVFQDADIGIRHPQSFCINA